MKIPKTSPLLTVDGSIIYQVQQQKQQQAHERQHRHICNICAPWATMRCQVLEMSSL